MNQPPSTLSSQAGVGQSLQPGFLTPVATSPLPFGSVQSLIPMMPVISLPKSPNSAPKSPTQVSVSVSTSPRSSVPMVSMLGSPQYNGSQPSLHGIPTIEEINSLARQIATLFSAQQQVPTMNLPTVSVANLPSSVQLPSVAFSPVQFPSVQLPSVQFPSAQLPSVQLPNVSGIPLVTLPNIGGSSFLPTVTLPGVSLPGLDLSSFGTLGLFVPTSLADNEIGDLRWNRPNPPQPVETTSSYRRIGCIGDGSCFFHAVSKGLSEIYQLSYYSFNDVSEETLRKFETAINNLITFPSTMFTTPRQADPIVRYVFAPPYGRTAFENLMAQFRAMYVRMLRQDFANHVLNNARMQGLIRQKLSGSIDLRIDTLIARALNKGQILTREQVQDQSFRDVATRLAQELLSGNAVQPDFMLLLSDYVDIDIYLLRDADLINPNPRNTPLYSGSSLHAAVHGPVDMRPDNDIYAELRERRAIVIISIDDYHYEIVARVDETEGVDAHQRQIHPNMTQAEPLIRRLYEILVNLRATSQ